MENKSTSKAPEEVNWITLNRKILDWEWYSNTNVTRVFIHCLLRANFKDNKWGGMTIKRGNFITSIKNLCQELGMSTQKTKSALLKLQNTQDLTIKTTNKNSLICVVNYDKYQKDNKQNNKQITNKQQTNNKQITINNNVNKENNKIIKEKKEDLCRWFFDKFNSSIKPTNIPSCKKLSQTRRDKIKTRFNDGNKNYWKKVFRKIKKYTNVNKEDNGWLDFDFLIRNYENSEKILNGKYDFLIGHKKTNSNKSPNQPKKNKTKLLINLKVYEQRFLNEGWDYLKSIVKNQTRWENLTEEDKYYFYNDFYINWNDNHEEIVSNAKWRRDMKKPHETAFIMKYFGNFVEQEITSWMDDFQLKNFLHHTQNFKNFWRWYKKYKHRDIYN